MFQYNKYLKISFKNEDEVKKAYNFSSLQDFLDIYYIGTKVFKTEDDFYDLTFEYIKKANKDNVKHVELFFDPQTHLENNVDFNTVINGITKALEMANKQFGITSKLIMCILRHLPEQSALDLLEIASPHKDKIYAIGLDSSEKGFPPNLFKHVYKKASEQGYKLVAHVGEEGSPDYVWQALKILKVARIDHGIRSIEDNQLIDYLIDHKIPLTMCPLSNQKLQAVPDLKKHPLKIMLDKGVMVMINSDDPAYFGGYINDNYLAITKALSLDEYDLIKLAKNSINATFLQNDEKERLLKEINNIANSWIINNPK